MRASIAVDGAYDAAYPYIRASAAQTSSTSVVVPWENRIAIILRHETHDRLALMNYKWGQSLEGNGVLYDLFTMVNGFYYDYDGS